MTDSTPSKRSFAVGTLPAILSGLAIVALWKAASAASASALILPAPEAVLLEFARLASGGAFYAALGATALRGLLSLALSLAIGGGLGFLAGLFPAARSALKPLLSAIRSTPVLALILLLLIWFPQDAVPVVSAVLMAFPVFLSAVIEGIGATESELMEMAAVFKMRRRDVLRAIRLPALAPFLVTGLSGALSLIWKVVVAGEVLSLPRRAIGTSLHDAKIYLDTTEAFAWALAAILLCAATDAIFAIALKRMRRGA